MALRFLQEHAPSVPAPLWIDDYKDHEQNTVLIMTEVPGQPLSSVFHRLSYEEREQLSQDLKSTIHQLRRIPNFSSYRFANAFGGALFDYRVGGTFGPFAQASDFHNYIIPSYTSENTKAPMRPIHARYQESFFTHADLNWRNIIMNQGRLSGLVDWECAGYCPQYWEFTKAIYGILNHKDMEKVVRDAFDEDYEEELEVERKLWDAAPWGI